MTTTRYFIIHLAQAFGYHKRTLRMADAASEMHLLREAEACLGSEVWQNVEGIDALSVEYWNLRKLIKEREEVGVKTAACQEKLDRAHEERSKLLNNTPEESVQLHDARMKTLSKLEELALKRDQIVSDAREVRRTYIGLKTKLEVLSKESTDTQPDLQEVDGVKGQLAELKSRFTQLKQERIKIGREIDAGDVKVDLIDEKLKESRNDYRQLASKAFQVIGDGNKEISILRAESGLLDTRMRQLYAEIGRYVSSHASRDPACATASAKHRGLVEIMRAIRHSISLNHRLAGIS